ncbi:penicillin-binding protein 1C [Megalodesulfovibrio gigas]|uniref:peptidoglycan glycosyltransferase n=1 Tax=Megalodesulfovibrio gigas (strain ATCC 19364 / DSM 1382 / NCIMB 9332 / VKM B-1759) TaxID=1121448 RepID=T2GFC1_MEGG1|nr:penicillin-binding protein 1C [Megalodesulfovibrio gigas]AGW14587.1 putative Penicillin-binding protein 1C [Megalodesulfovibrio gigas DSM 1382 = ATCC 19364]
MPWPAWCSRIFRRRAFASLGLWGGGALLLLWLVFLGLDQLFPFPWDALNQTPAVTVQDRHGRPLRVFLPPDGRRRQPVPLAQVSPLFRAVLVASEDRHFHRHPGVNPLAILRAAVMNLRAGRVVSGGSTITMQLARLCEPRERTIGAKLLESFRALQLEWRLSKDEILERYINMTPYGGNVVGVAAAAESYFGKDQQHLSLGEAALLTVLPRAPQGYDPVKNPQAARRARDRLLAVLERRGRIDAVQRRQAMAQQLPEGVTPLPRLAPHLAELAKALAEQRLPPGDSGRVMVATTIDRALQTAVESRLRDSAEWIRRQRLENAAVVVIENETRAVRAMAGSIEYMDFEHHGFINGCLIARSPGSALKPFLYAQAMDMGLIVPKSYLLDIPTDISGYSVRNFDGTFQGMITVEAALVQSRNVPAVRLLAQVAPPAFLELLRQAGLSTLKKTPYEYGLPLALGACEVTLLELANAYASLATLGQYRPPALLLQEEQAPPPAARILSREASWLTLDMLTRVERADLPRSWQHAKDAPSVAWKTGTSFGHRDAWAVGVSRQYTIGVWVGNLDGRAEMGISGATHAGPLLFDLFRVVEGAGAALTRPLDLALTTMAVCAADHLLPGPACPDRTEVTVIEGRTRLPRSELHQRIFVHPETGERVAGDCLQHLPHVPRLVRQYPVEFTAWMRAQGVQGEAMPAMHPTCHAAAAGEGPQVVSPDPRTPYRLRSDAPREFQRIGLKAFAGPDVRELFWYQDGSLKGSGAPDAQIFLPLEPGRHTLVVVDDQGRASQVEYRVE